MEDAYSYIVRLREKGQVTLPKTLRKNLGLGTSETLTAYGMGQAIILTPKRLTRASLSREFESQMAQKNLTLDNLVADLREQRKQYNKENHGI
ncbi:AbrB/MazE/SpoVT family DNA-binding domain-containing protein [Elusimicrobiota bacterium]